MKFKAKLDNAWIKGCKLSVIDPYLTLKEEAVSLPQYGRYYNVNGYQLVIPYYKEVVLKVKDKRYNTAMELLKGEFTGKHNPRHLTLGIPQERDLHYWNQLKNGNLIWVKASRKVSKLNDQFKVQYEGCDLKKNISMTLSGKDLDHFDLKPKDEIFTINCIHELPVPIGATGSQIKIIYQDDNMVVVDKPYGIPVHPTGNSYRFNTVMNLLKKQLNLKLDLWPCHRLDKDTTGILIFAKTSAICGKVSQLITNKGVFAKMYLANVHGLFPNELKSVGKVFSLDLTKEYGKGGIMCSPLEASSNFNLVKYDQENNVSTVKVDLKTGRRHQIRQHLRNLGFPIVNDPLYGINAPLSAPMYKLPNEQEFNILRSKYLKVHEQKMTSGTPVDVCHDCAHVTYIPEHLKLNQMQLHALEYKSSLGNVSFKTDAPSWCPHYQEEC